MNLNIKKYFSIQQKRLSSIQVIVSRAVNQGSNLKAPLRCVHGSAVFQPGEAGRRDATGDALQADGLVENN